MCLGALTYPEPYSTTMSGSLAWRSGNGRVTNRKGQQRRLVVIFTAVFFTSAVCGSLEAPATVYIRFGSRVAWIFMLIDFRTCFVSILTLCTGRVLPRSANLPRRDTDTWRSCMMIGCTCTEGATGTASLATMLSSFHLRRCRGSGPLPAEQHKKHFITLLSCTKAPCLRDLHDFCCCCCSLFFKKRYTFGGYRKTYNEIQEYRFATKSWSFL